MLKVGGQDPFNYCRNGGYLVNGTEELPADPGEFSPPGTLRYTGCNRLRCRDCGQSVRSATGFDVKESAEDHWPEIYAAEDWRELPWLKICLNKASRLYVCPCGFLDVEQTETCENDDGPDCPWSCGGHPLAIPGQKYFGVTVSLELDWKALVIRAFQGWIPRGNKREANLASDPYQAVWLRDLICRLSGTAMGEALGQAVAAALSHPDLIVRALALRCFYAMPLMPGAQRLDALLTEDRDLFAGHPNPFPTDDADLEAWLLRALGARLEEGGDPALGEQLRLEVCRPGKAEPLLRSLALCDGDWLAAHGLEVVRATPAAASPLLLALRRGGIRASTQIALALAREPGLDQTLLRKTVSTFFSDPARSEILAALGQV